MKSKIYAKSVVVGGLAVVLATMLAACENEAEKAATQSDVLTAATVPVIRYQPAIASQAAIASKLAGLAAAMGHSVKASDIQLRETLSIAGKGADDVRLNLAFSGDALLGRYESADDSFEVYEAVSDPMVPGASDIDEGMARSIFESTLSSLQASGVLAPERSKASDVTVRAFYAAEGNQDGAKRKWINEFVFFVPTKLNGVGIGTFSQEYGVWINVHRSGRVRRIELSGASATSADNSSIALVRSTPTSVSAAPSVDAAAKASFGSATLEPLGLRLVVEDVAAGSEVTPRQLFRVVPLGVAGDGTQIRGKAFVGSYPVTEPSAKVLISPAPGTQASEPGDKKP